MNLRLAALSLSLLCACSVAQAQTVPFSAISSGNQAPPGAQTGNHVARSANELSQLGFSGVTGVNFQRDVVLVIVQPLQISLGNPVRVGVERVTQQGQDLRVDYRVFRPFAFGAPVSSQPFVLVRTKRTSGSVSFQESGQPALPLPTPTPSPGLVPPGQLPFHVIGEGSTSDEKLISGQHLFRSGQELEASGYEGLVRDPKAIRWDVEMVAVLLMGEANYRVRSTKLRGSLSNPSGGQLTLDYELSQVFPTNARWYQVVRIPRVAELRFEEVLPADAVKGKVHVLRGFGVSLVSLDTKDGRIALLPRARAEELVPLEGEVVFLSGRKTGTAILQIRRLIEPQPFSGSGRLVGVPGKPRLAQPGHSLNLIGDLAPTLERGIGREVNRLRGYRFADRRLVVTQYAAWAKRPTDVTRVGTVVSRLSFGQAVTVRDTGLSGLFVVPSRQGAPGWVDPDALSLSPTTTPVITLTPPGASTPPATSTTAPGITGTIRSSGPR